jgi:hypothetical protein
MARRASSVNSTYRAYVLMRPLWDQQRDDDRGDEHDVRRDPEDPGALLGD